MPRRLARKLMLSITVIVIIVAAVSGLVNVKTEEQQLLNTMVLGADQLSKGITSATWHAMLDDHREAAYQVMQTIALKQGIDRIRMFNRAGQAMFSTNAEDRQQAIPRPDLSRHVSVFQVGRRRRLDMVTPSTTSRPARRPRATRIPPASRCWGCWICNSTWTPWITKWPI